jgi:hypothetical protein
VIDPLDGFETSTWYKGFGLPVRIAELCPFGLCS